MNVRESKSLSKEFLEIQDEFLQEQVKEKGVVKLVDIDTIPANDKISLYKGDIMYLKI